jgi:xanthine dehydrogenase YagT iron-sulfur-binding subunit
MNDSSGKPPGGISRRGFLTGTGAAAAAAAGLTAELAPTAAQPGAGDKPAQFGPAPAQVALTVNGKPLTVSVEPRVTLLDALRDFLDVTGCKRVCDRGTCGACTVLLDGRPVYSCTMLALEARGKQVKTAEALAEGGKLDPVPAAFGDCDAQQCGFCTPGFVVSLRAALDRNPAATPAQLAEATTGNICRCGTYEQMRHAIEQLCRKGG